MLETGFSIKFPAVVWKKKDFLEFLYIYDLGPLSGHYLKIFSAHIRMSLLGCIPIFRENILTAQHDILALLWFQFNPYPNHLPGGIGGVFPLALFVIATTYK